MLRVERWIVVVGLVLVTALAWDYLLRVAASMPMPGPMHGMAMSAMPGMSLAPGFRAWGGVEFLLTFTMWAVMMAAMMTPSASPAILLYAHVARHATSAGRRLAAPGWFAAGYGLSWSAFSLAATAAQALLDRAARLSPGMKLASPALGGAVLIAAGMYQLTPLKSACLSHCQSPASFFQHHGGFRPGARASIGLGARHGLYCIGCCWALMTLLFVGGVMNLVWIAGLAALVLLEKLARGRAVPLVAGLGLIAAGLGTALHR